MMVMILEKGDDAGRNGDGDGDGACDTASLFLCPRLHVSYMLAGAGSNDFMLARHLQPAEKETNN